MPVFQTPSNTNWTNLFRTWALSALGVLLAATIVPGISFQGNFLTLLLVVVVLSFFNAVLRPVLILFALPFVVLTMGLGIILINALLLWFTGQFVPGFEVEGFWAPIGGAFIIAITAMIANMLLGKGGIRIVRGRPGGRPPRDNDRYIDV